MSAVLYPRRVRSYTCRQKRLTPFQRVLWQQEWSRYGLSPSSLSFLGEAPFNFDQIFGRVAPRVLEIGFGDGCSLLEMAKAAPDTDFIGIEVYSRGIASLLANASAVGLANLRIIFGDAVEILTQSFPVASLACIQIFFADPWPKTRHHKRRLIQPSFVSLLAEKLKVGGTLRLATDWADYAQQMMLVVSQNEGFSNLAGEGQFSPRLLDRPVTKYEKLALAAGRCIYDLCFRKDF